MLMHPLRRLGEANEGIDIGRCGVETRVANVRRLARATLDNKSGRAIGLLA